MPSAFAALAVATLLCAPCSMAQDLRNDMFRPLDTRSAIYERPNNVRSSAVVVNPALAPFYYGVASGDPLPTSVILWTRVTPSSMGPVVVTWRVATDPGMANVVQSGSATATIDRDYTVKIDVTGLQPGTVYYYNFEFAGIQSMIGRTRTTAASGLQHTRLAIVSCSNLPAGFFNAYAAVARRNDLDAVVHLGDYIYEYRADSTTAGGQIAQRMDRLHDPLNEIITLTDYRARYAQYRLDPDLQELHRQHPIIHVWDDHESANDAYTEGAQNHQATEGSWSDRKDVSKRVCMEWMATREAPSGQIYRSLSFGDMVELLMLDTRLDGRDKQVEGLGSQATQASRDSLNNPNRRIISEAQFDWLSNGLSTSTAHWKVLGNQVMFTPVVSEPIDTAFLFATVGPLFSSFLRPQVPALQDLMNRGFQGDVWSNYPAQRQRLASVIQAQNVRNVVIATGDFHTTFAFDVPFNFPGTTQPIAVEFMTPSVSSTNFDENLVTVPAVALIVDPLVETIERTLSNNNRFIKAMDLVHHGYIILDFTEQRVQGDVFFVDTLYVRSATESWWQGWFKTVDADSLQRSTQQALGKVLQDVPAPPPSATSVAESSPFHVLSVAPNPASQYLSITLSNATGAPAHISIVDLAGRTVAFTQSAMGGVGLHSTIIDVSSLPSGSYVVRVAVGAAVADSQFTIAR